MNHTGFLGKNKTDSFIGFLYHPLPVNRCKIRPFANRLPGGFHMKFSASRKTAGRFAKDLRPIGFELKPFTLGRRKPLLSGPIVQLEEHRPDIGPLFNDTLPIIDGWAVPILNTIFCANDTVGFTLNKAEYGFAFEPEVECTQPINYTPALTATLVADNHRFSVGFEHMNFIDALDGVITQKLPPQIQCAFFEAWFGILLEKLEKWRGTRIHVDSLIAGPDVTGNDDYTLYFRLSRKSDKFEAKGHLSMGKEAMKWLAEGYNREINNGNFPCTEKVPFELGFEIGWMQIDYEQFSRLVSNDILLPDMCTFDNSGRSVLVRLAHGLCWVGTIENDTITITAAGEVPMGNGIDTPNKAQQESGEAAGRQPVKGNIANPNNSAGGSVQNNAGADENQNQEQVLSAPVLDGLFIDLVFEVGRRKITLQELRKIKPGYTFDLATPLERSISVVANGRTVGKGTLVQIDQRIGVRLVEIAS
jgi:type III secretion system YscQ/HrcQ family protein